MSSNSLANFKYFQLYLIGVSAAIYLIGVSHRYISQVYLICISHRYISQVYLQRYISQVYLIGISHRYISQVYLICISAAIYLIGISHRCICSDICHRNYKISTFFMLLYWVISTVYIFQQNQLCLFLTVKSFMLIPYS